MALFWQNTLYLSLYLVLCMIFHFICSIKHDNLPYIWCYKRSNDFRVMPLLALWSRSSVIYTRLLLFSNLWALVPRIWLCKYSCEVSDGEPLSGQVVTVAERIRLCHSAGVLRREWQWQPSLLAAFRFNLTPPSRPPDSEQAFPAPPPQVLISQRGRNSWARSSARRFARNRRRTPPPNCTAPDRVCAIVALSKPDGGRLRVTGHLYTSAAPL